MSSVAKIVRAKGTMWQARWFDPEGRLRKQSFPRKIDAERHLVTIDADNLRGAYVDPRAGRAALGEFAEQRWLPGLVHIRPTTRELYCSHLRNHIIPVFGRRPLSSLRRTDCKTFVAALNARLAPSTVHVVFAVLRSLMQAAVDDGLIVANPCARVPLPRVEQRVAEPLPARTVVALAAAMPPRYAAAVWLAAGAGLREGEALGLTGARVDFLRRRINVEEQVQGINGGEPELVALKTRASRRVVPVDDIVLEALSRHIEDWEPGPGGVLITNRLGRPVRRSSFGACWRVAVAQCDLPEGTRFHDLRHFYASSLIAAGLHPKAIQVRLGHASISETMDTYGHLFPDSKESGRGALDAA